MYDALGNMARHVAPDREVGKAGDVPTGDEARAMLDGYIAYSGTYTVDDKARTVTHHRKASVQPGDKGDLVRGYEFAGERLILRPVGTNAEVIWERNAQVRRYDSASLRKLRSSCPESITPAVALFARPGTMDSRSSLRSAPE